MKSNLNPFLLFFLGVGLGVGVILIFLSQDETSKPKIEISSFSKTNPNTGNVMEHLKLEFRETLKIERPVINEGNCHINPFDSEIYEYPVTIGMGTILDPMTSCDFLVEVVIETDKGTIRHTF